MIINSIHLCNLILLFWSKALLTRISTKVLTKSWYLRILFRHYLSFMIYANLWFMRHIFMHSNNQTTQILPSCFIVFTCNKFMDYLLYYSIFCLTFFGQFLFVVFFALEYFKAQHTTMKALNMSTIIYFIW